MTAPAYAPVIPGDLTPDALEALEDIEQREWLESCEAIGEAHWKQRAALARAEGGAK